jgi:murein DD-endopeptidase MepM/ murein hydrolase activator NlpD
MNSLYQSEDAVLEADKVLNKPLVSVLSGENLIVKTPAKPHKDLKDKKRPGLFGRTPQERKKRKPSNKTAPEPLFSGPLFSPAALTYTYEEPPELRLVKNKTPKNKTPIRVRLPIKPSRKTLLRALIATTIIFSIGGAGMLVASLTSHSYPVISLPDEDSAQEALMAMLEPEPSAPPSGDTALPPLPSLLVERTYTVRRGDTLQTIARQFGLREDTIISANNLSSKNQLVASKTLKVPNMNGVYHTVKRNENLSVISRAYGVDMTRIADANNISSSTIRAGDRLFIPSAKLSASVLRDFYGETFIWPARGPISSPFGYRINPFSGQRTFHSAIDIVVNRGTPVKATREGKVADTGYNAVFGNYVIIRHADGYQSLYAHLDTILTRKGASVNQGEVIGRSGNTGQSTGPHLHFGMFRNGQAVDPRKYLQ